ncbi:MAG: cadherin-like domain-containing protein [Acidobacteria bacterium]|nr:cadherin-like domain-containing protein [Acidobacteriota bacterium]
MKAYWRLDDLSDNVFSDETGNGFSAARRGTSIFLIPNEAMTNEDTVLNDRLFAYDLDEDALTFSLTRLPAKGTLTITDATTGAFTYTPNANANGFDEFAFTVTDGAQTSTQALFFLTIKAVNDVPLISTTAQTRQAGSFSVTSAIGSASDVEDAAPTLNPLVNNATLATVNGVTVSNLTINPAGVISATIGAVCGASNASFTLKVTDSQSATATTTLNVTVTPNPPPVLSYNSTANVAAGGALTLNPLTGPSDNLSVASVNVLNAGTYTGGLTVNSAGVVTLNNAKPGGTHTLTIRATDNCGATTDVPITLTVTCPTISVATVSSPNGMLNQPYAATFTQSGGATLVVFSLGSGVLPTGLTLNPTTGVLSGQPTQAGVFPITVCATDANGCKGTSASFALDLNTPPVINPLALTLEAGKPAGAPLTIATVSDAETAAGSLFVVSLGNANGVTLTNLVNNNGTITAHVTVSCAATTGTLALAVSDGRSETQANLSITVTHPTLALGAYAAKSVQLGTEASYAPASAPTAYVANAYATATSAPGQSPFAGLLAVNPTSGAVRISNPQPAGTFTVTVRAQGGCGTAVSQSFTLTVTNPITCATTNFAAASTVDASGFISEVIAGDFDADGKQDLVGLKGSIAQLWRGNGTGGFVAPVVLDTGAGSAGLAAGDFNGDGRLDVASTSNMDVRVLLQQPDGQFALTSFTAGLRPAALKLADFNRDGRLDFAVADTTNGVVTVALGNGTGGVVSALNIPVTNARSLAVGDFNADGNADLIVNRLGTLTTLLGDGAGGFSTGAPLNISSSFGMAVGDFNRDGQTDVALTQYLTGRVQVLLGQGNGTFTTGASISVATNPDQIVASDFNGDGVCDLAVTYQSTNATILLGNGQGGFPLSSELPLGAVGRVLAVGDFDANGKADLVTTAVNANAKLQVTLNQCALNTPPTLTPVTLTRTQGQPLANLTIANANDQLQPLEQLTVKVNNGANATVNGVTLANLAINSSGVISADVTAACNATSASLTLSVTDSANVTVNATLNVTVNDDTQPTLLYSGSQSVPMGQSLTVTPTFNVSSNGTALTYNVVGVNTSFGGPFGGTATVNAAGVVSLNNVRPAGGYLAVIRATDQCGLARDALLSFIAQCPTLTLNPATLPNGLRNQPYNQLLAVTGGLAPYAFTLSNNSVLPNGMTFSAAGLLSGTPTQSGSFGLGITATDANGCTTTNNLALQIVSNQPPTVTPFAVELYQGENNNTVLFGQVSDDRTPLTNLTVRQIAGGTATGLSFANVRIDTSTPPGNWLIATVSTACNAASGTVCFEITDGDGAVTKHTAPVTVRNSGVSVLSYNNPPVPLNLQSNTTVNPVTGFPRTNLIQSVAVRSVTPVGFTGTITVANGGIVTISNAAPVGTYTATIRATDVCNVVRDASFTFSVIVPPPNALMINEWRTSGPNGVDDWYVELYNNTDFPRSTAGLSLLGLSLAGNGFYALPLTPQIIQPRGYYLIAGATYSLTHVPPDDLSPPLDGIGLVGGWWLSNDNSDTLDRAGTTAILGNGLAQFFYEGTPVPSLGLVTAEHAWVRKSATTGAGLPVHTKNNLADFILVATVTTPLNGVTPQPGAPGPQNSASPVVNNAGLPVALLNPAVSANNAPNVLVESVPVTVGSATYPRSLYLRRSLTNNTGRAVTKLRFRIVEISNGGVNTAILRALNSDDITLTINGQSVAVKGLTLEAPTQPTGGGLNSTLCAGSITLAAPLAKGAKVNVQFRLGIAQGGFYRFYANVEAAN